MNISIITPAYNGLPYIPSCVRSVRQQASFTRFELEHNVMDGNSSDGTVEFMKALTAKEDATKSYELTFTSEADNGMYSALNKAFAATNGDVVGHLNADEQYLPGTLDFVVSYFEKHPDVDVLFGAVVVVDTSGEYISSRMPIIPKILHTQVCHLCTFTAAMFFRRQAIVGLNRYFDETFKTAGDADLVCRMIEAGIKMATVNKYFSTFIDSGENLALTSQAKSEEKRLLKRAPVWAQKMRTIIKLQHRVRKYFSGAYSLKPFEYVYIENSGKNRRTSVKAPTGRWRSR